MKEETGAQNNSTRLVKTNFYFSFKFFSILMKLLVRLKYLSKQSYFLHLKKKILESSDIKMALEVCTR